METKVEKKILKPPKNFFFDKSEAIKSLISTIDPSFVNVVQTILHSKGKSVLCRNWKKWNNSPKKQLYKTQQDNKLSFFMDAADGDLGIIDDTDFIIILSKTEIHLNLKLWFRLLKDCIIKKVNDIYPSNEAPIY